MSITITEALAEIKTIIKRIAKRRDGIYAYLTRAENLKDPLEKDGGSAEFIKRERQAIADLEARIVALREGIAAANDATKVTINGVTRTISQWLTWRRDVAPNQQSHLALMRARIQQARDQAKRSGATVIAAAAAVSGSESKPGDWVVNVDETALAAEIDAMEDTLGQLDGQLSLKNATTQIKE